MPATEPQTILASAPLPPSDFILDISTVGAKDSTESLKDAHYTGTIQRFFQSEVKPIYFGKGDLAHLRVLLFTFS